MVPDSAMEDQISSMNFISDLRTENKHNLNIMLNWISYQCILVSTGEFVEFHLQYINILYLECLHHLSKLDLPVNNDI